MSNPPRLRSWLPIEPDSHFSVHNLPVGMYRRPGEELPRACSALGDRIVDLLALEEHGLFDGHLPPGTFSETEWNWFLRLGPDAWRAARRRLQRLLDAEEPALRDDAALREAALLPMDQVQLTMPVRIGNYTDFYSSREHATNVGTMLRGPDNALMPNWVHLPVAYHGRASSIVVSGTDVRRPLGQTRKDENAPPTFGPCRNLDFELELGYVVGQGNALGHPIPVAEAARHVYGVVLVNDWSARDIQKWEYQPLGPFLAKNFATSISPWLVSLDALEPFRVPGPVQDPPPLSYMRSEGPWAYDIHLEVRLRTPALDQPHTICRSNAKYLYWNLCQQVAHHTCGGCNLETGDLLATGTISGPEPASYGSLLELAWKGTRPLTLPSGETRTFLEDGDEVILTGWCQGDGYRVGLGEVTAKVLPAAG